MPFLYFKAEIFCDFTSLCNRFYKMYRYRCHFISQKEGGGGGRRINRGERRKRIKEAGSKRELEVREAAFRKVISECFFCANQQEEIYEQFNYDGPSGP